MLNYFRLVRLPNLLMIPLTMYLIRYGIIEPALRCGYSFSLQTNVELQLPDRLFLIVVLINIFLGAAGYVINDYFDRKIDAINRPDKVLIGKKINRRTAIILHSVLNGIALVLAAYLSWVIRKPSVFIVYAMLSGIFWLYSTTYKKQLLLGNIIVSLLTALVPLQVAYFDILPLNENYANQLIMTGISFKALFNWVAAFACFAFILNFIREIIKDTEDYEGDKSYDCYSLPIAIGVTWTKIIVSFIVIGILAGLGIIYYSFLYDPLSKWYILLAIALPLILSIILLIKAKTPNHYHQVSILIKIIMLTGMLYTLVARHVMIFNFNV